VLNYPKIEEIVKTWINLIRDEEIILQTKNILEKAFSIAASQDVKFFKKSKYASILYLE
jgi:hypothetical protein